MLVNPSSTTCPFQDLLYETEDDVMSMNCTDWLLRTFLWGVLPLSLTCMVVSPGCSWNFMLYWSLCVHHLWRLRPLLWRRVHSDPRCHYNCRRDASIHHRSDWVLCHDTWKLLRSCNSEWASLAHHQQNAVAENTNIPFHLDLSQCSPEHVLL